MVGDMDIPLEILEEIKCGMCDSYLSRSPVYLQHNGAAACDQCFHPDLPATRNIHYEATAKLLRFPCKNRALGCLETVPFADKGQLLDHDLTCDYRQYACPVLSPSNCDWSGTKKEILLHCMENHNDLVLDNPSTLELDMATSSSQNFVIKAFHLLFLLHTKVCLASGKIFYAVRLLGDSNLITKFKFNLNIKRGDCEVSRPGNVAPIGFLALQDPIALVLDMNSLLDELGGSDKVTFTMEVERRCLSKCVICGVDVHMMVYRDEDGWRCDHCSPPKEPCRNRDQGCMHRDIYYKCVKHEWYFCDQSTECFLCEESAIVGALTAHYTSAHSNLTYGSGSTWKASWTGDLTSRFILLSSCVGIAVCRYWLDKRGFELQVYISVLSEGLCEFRCTVRITDPITNLTRVYTPDFTFHHWSDWRVEIRDEEWARELDISVDIIRVKLARASISQL